MKNLTKKITCFVAAAILMQSCVIISKRHYVTPISAGEKNHYGITSNHTRQKSDYKQLLMLDEMKNHAVYLDIPCWQTKKKDVFAMNLIFEADSLWIPNLYINGIIAELEGEKTPMQIAGAWLQIKNGNDDSDVLNEKNIDLYKTNFVDELKKMRKAASLNLASGKLYANIRIEFNKQIKDLKKKRIFFNIDFDADDKQYLSENLEYNRSTDYYVFTALHVVTYAAIGVVLVWLEWFSED